MHRQALRIALIAMLTALTALAPLGMSPALATAETPLTVALSVDGATVDPQTGGVILSGTVTCSEPAYVKVYGNLTQGTEKSRQTSASSDTAVYCTGPESTAFTILFTHDYVYFEGRFTAGWVSLSLTANGIIYETGTGEPEYGESGPIDMTLLLTPR